jgi:hypothetical protein
VSSIARSDRLARSLALVVAALVLGLGACTRGAIGTAIPAHEAPADVLIETRGLTGRVLDLLLRADAPGLVALFAPGVPTAGAAELLAAFATLGPAPELQPLAAYLLTLADAPGATHQDAPITLPQNGAVPPLVLQGIQLEGSRAHVDLLVSGGAAARHRPLLLIILVESGGRWLLQSVQLGSYAMAGATAGELAERAEQAVRSSSNATGAIIALTGLRTLNLAPSLRYAADAQMRERLATTLRTASERIGFPVGIAAGTGVRTVSVVRLEMLLVRGRVLPVVVYQSSVADLEAGAVQREAEMVAANLGPLADLGQSFQNAVFRAFTDAAEFQRTGAGFNVLVRL